jgi:hypothetical protein
MSTVQIPSTPAGINFATWLEAFNSNSETALRAYYEQNFHESESTGGVADSTANELSFGLRTGGFNIQQIIISEPTKISVLLQQRNYSEKHSAVTVELEPVEPYYVRRFTIQLQEQEVEGGEGGEEIPAATQVKNDG